MILQCDTGETQILTATFKDAGGVLTNPTGGVTARAVRAGRASTPTSLTVANTATGAYQARFTPAAAGTWIVRFEGVSGTDVMVVEQAVIARPSDFTAASWDNRPATDRLARQIRVSAAAEPALGIDTATIDADLLDDLLDASIAYVEERAHTSFNGRNRVEVRDGNGTTGMTLLRWPPTSISQVKVELPVLALSRVYTASEIKLYSLQGRFSIFTYKLAAEHASLHLDRMVYGNLLPPLPQCVEIRYTYGFPNYDQALDQTSLDGGATWIAGDTRDPAMTNRMRELQQAVICDAAASFLSQAASLGVGLVQAVSFDGFSKTFSGQPYSMQAQALIDRRDDLLAARKRMHLTSTTLR